MKLWLMPLFLVFFFTHSSSASMLNGSFTGTGEILNNSLEKHGILDGETVSYNGNFFIDTDLIAIDYIYFNGGLVTNIKASGDFITSGAITVDDRILPVMPESNAILYFNLNDISNPLSYETSLLFDVLSPFTGEVYRQNLQFVNLFFHFSTDYFFDQDDPFLQPLLAWQSSLSGLFSDELFIGSPGGPLNFVQYPATAPVPEPATMILFGIGLAGLATSRFKRNNNI